MNKTEFARLTEQQQMRALWYGAVHIATCRQGTSRFELFQLNNFYVEIKWLRFFNIRQSVKTFRDMTVVDKYLPQIDISELPFISSPRLKNR